MRVELLFFICIIFFSCTNNEKISITGNLKNSQGKYVVLKKLKANSTEPIDSIVLGSDGSFAFELQYKEPAFYMMNIDKTNFIYLLVDTTGEIKINGDANNLIQTYSVSGSESSEQLKKLHQYLNKTLNSMDSLGVIYNKYYKTPQADSVITDLNFASFKITNQAKDFLVNFIYQNKKSLACYIGLFQQISPRDYILKPIDDFEIFSMVDSSLSKKYPESEYTQKLKSIVERSEVEVLRIKKQETALKIGSIAPDLTMPDKNGKLFSISELKGKNILLYFWASWHKPCREENKQLESLKRKYLSKGFEVFQVSLDKSKEDWLNAIQNDKLTGIQVNDLLFWESVAVKTYQLKEIPTSYLISKDGKILLKNPSLDQLNSLLNSL